MTGLSEEFGNGTATHRRQREGRVLPGGAQR
jgi:hypothetical protein